MVASGPTVRELRVRTRVHGRKYSEESAKRQAQKGLFYAVSEYPGGDCPGTGRYETSWYVWHRIRAAMKEGVLRHSTGTIEVDETYVGGDDKNRHFGKELGRGAKTVVIGAIARNGVANTAAARSP